MSVRFSLAVWVRRGIAWTTLFCLPLLFAVTGAFAEPPERWALLIGIDRYKDRDRINDLSSAAHDARGLKQALIEAVGFPADHIQLLVSDAATDAPGEALPERSLILRELALLARRVHPGDLVFVAFSGHGIQLNNRSYLLPYDADAYDAGTLTDSCIETVTFQERLKKVAAGVLVLAFDMCRTSPLKTGREAIVPPNPLTADQVRGLDFNLPASTPGTDQTGPQTVAYLYSCREGQQSFEWTQKQRSYFSYYLETGLRGEASEPNGAVRLDVLQSYLSKAVTDAVRTTEQKEQVPYFKVEGALPANRVTLIEGVPDTNARLSLNVQPADAKVTVDGAPLTSNTIVQDLGRNREKEVELAISASGYDSKVQKVTLIRGSVVPFSVSLERHPGPAVKTNPKDGAEMILIPAGPFIRGVHAPAVGVWPATEPQEIRMSAYYIYKNLVTVGMYEKFCKATHRPLPPGNRDWTKKDHPMEGLAWFEARAYCEWAGVRLPTEAQWEKAARGTDGRAYPWGNDWDKSKLACSRDRHRDAGGTWPVGSFPAGASPYGVLDMAGNVPQWCYDVCEWDFPMSPAGTRMDPVNPASGDKLPRALRGGEWTEYDSHAFRTYNRGRKLPGDRVGGFRCAAPAAR